MLLNLSSLCTFHIINAAQMQASGFSKHALRLSNNTSIYQPRRHRHYCGLHACMLLGTDLSSVQKGYGHKPIRYTSDTHPQPFLHAHTQHIIHNKRTDQLLAPSTALLSILCSLWACVASSTDSRCSHMGWAFLTFLLINI